MNSANNTRTLAIILNHNRQALTDRVYELLKPHVGSLAHVTVLDNGSTRAQEISAHTEFRLDTNVYFGGAFNAALDIVKQDPQWDSLLFLNNDIILHGWNFVPTLRNLLFEQDFAQVSPCVLQPEQTQCFWPHMHNWGSDRPRPVQWLDFMAVMLRRDLILALDPIDPQLALGWGVDIQVALTCESRQWRAAVTDSLSVIHFAEQTTKDGAAAISREAYNRHAEQNMFAYFQRRGQTQDLLRLRHWSRNYQFTGAANA